jgi:hypothetical protein
MTVPQVESRVIRGVPVGSSREEVEKWLDLQGFGSYYLAASEYELKYESSVHDAGLDPDSLGGIVTAMIPDTDRSFMVQGSIRLNFFLDKEGKTVKHLVKWVGTGP